MMDMTMKKVVEASYLTADSAAHYRTILRFFYHQHERMRDFITPEEVLEHMRSVPAFHDYGEEQLHQQLAQLVKWKNLVARQDMTKAKTVEEYKKKRYRYQSTPYTIEIERMLSVLEKKSDDTFQGSLERSQFDRLLQSLVSLQKEVEMPLAKNPEEYMALWEDIFRHFQTIRTSTADYIAYINSEKTDQRMQTEAFLVYKNQFTNYLRDFIVSLQKTSLQIKERLNEMPVEKLSGFFQKLIEHRRAIPRLEDVTASEAEWQTEYTEYWESLRQWFLGTAVNESELEVLQWQTNEMIRRMTRYVQRIGERHQHFRSRKNDYLHLAGWFAAAEGIDEAHRLSSVVFGAMKVKHLRLEEDTTDNMHAEVWEEDPAILTIKPRTNRYREKTKPGTISSNLEKKKLQREQYLKERERERQMINEYINEGAIQLSDLPTIDPFIRKLLLGWIGKSMAAKDRRVKTDYGFAVKVSIDKENMILLRAKDGDMRMPDTRFEFEQQGGGRK